jgi:Ca2+-binding EF-hand superfamily protein
MDSLLFKIKTQIKKDRIRLGEFFLDHDLLRKGSVPIQKFRGVLYSQKIQLTNEEYELLEKHFAVAGDPTRINYVLFNEDIEKIFTEKDLEKDPLKKVQEFKAPSILDPKDILNNEEEQRLDACLQRLGWIVQQKRLLIKPFFQDKDKSKSGFIANTRFRSIFDTMKLTISEDEY